MPGRNCSSIVAADRFGVVVDGDEYYRALEQAFKSARHSIFMLGWEFDSRTRLRRGPDSGPDHEIGRLLDRVVRKRPGLKAYVLIWDSALIYAMNREFAGVAKMNWFTHRGLCFRLDDSHPLGASQHQKIVVIDDCLAFVGGMDVSSQRWDTRAHLPDDPRRSDAAAPVYPPYHDVVAVMTGAVARALGDICRERWHNASGYRPQAAPHGIPPAWPDGVPTLFSQVGVAIARTRAPWDGLNEVREVEMLYVDMIAAARRFIFIENQYFASRRIAEALEARLSRPDCPEIVIINPGEPVNLMERSTMGVARARLYRRLADADHCGQLRIYYPSVEGRDVKVHSKVMVVDDCMLRIGSANLNNRSMGLDTECDVLVEAGGKAGVDAAIRYFRHDLLAEHLGVEPAEVAAAEEALDGSIHRAIEALQGRRHTLIALDGAEPSPIIQMIADSRLPDPEEPVETLVLVDEAMPGPARRPLQIRTWALAAVLAGVSVAGLLWRWAPHDLWAAAAPWVEWAAALRSLPETAALAAALFLVGGLIRLPVAVMVLATGMVLGTWLGTASSLAGALASAALIYQMGRTLGRARVRRLAGWKVNRVHRALARHGVLAIVLLRLMPVAAFSVINLIAGASGVALRDFALGTVLGMAPGIFAMSVVGDRLAAVLRNPSPVNIALLGAAAALVIIATFSLVDRLRRAGPLGRRTPR
ncbi:MAG: VTT domain-containing protein [Solirubrobacterales bacterium]